MDDKDLLIIRQLRKNARQSLTKISEETGIPITTVHDRIKLHEKRIIRKHAALVNFTEMGFQGRAHIALKTQKDQRAMLKNYLAGHKNINSLYVINYNFDFLAEVIFRDAKEVNAFVDELNQKFSITAMQIHQIIDEFQKEVFLTK